MIVAAIDTGGTKIAGAAVNHNGEILYKVRHPNTKRTGSFILETYAAIVEELRERHLVEAVGIGAGGRIDSAQGRVISAVDLYDDYIGLDIRKHIEEATGLPVVVDNDCRMALYGERWVGAASGIRDMVGVILGTGVGGGMIMADTPLLGNNGGAGEVGHILLHPGGRRCGCGQNGCAEQYVSGTALWRIYNDLIGEPAIASGQEFFKRYTEGDGRAAEILFRFSRDLADFAISLANLMDPEAILVGGGLADTADHWWEEFLTYYRERGSQYVQNIQLLRAQRGNDAALLGAAWLALRYIGEIV